jgi:hypothetical protein
MSITYRAFLATLILSLTFITQGLASGLEKFQFLKVAALEQKAVVKTPAGKLQVIGVGDVVADARVIEIAEGRVVLEEAGQEGPETVIIRLDGKHQRIERLRRQGEQPPVLVMPAKK